MIKEIPVCKGSITIKNQDKLISDAREMIRKYCLGYKVDNINIDYEMKGEYTGSCFSTNNNNCDIIKTDGHCTANKDVLEIYDYTYIIAVCLNRELCTELKATVTIFSNEVEKND